MRRNQGIRDPKAYYGAQQRRQNAFDSKVETAYAHLTRVLGKNQGVVSGTREEVYVHLIADGVLGAMKSNRHIASAIKQSRHSGTTLSLDDSYRLRGAISVVEQAILQAEEDGIVQREFFEQTLYLSLVDSGGSAEETLDDAEDLHFHPLQYRLPSGALAKIGDELSYY